MLYELAGDALIFHSQIAVREADDLTLAVIAAHWASRRTVEELLQIARSGVRTAHARKCTPTVASKQLRAERRRCIAK